MALNLNLSGIETTDFKQIILTDVTEDWGSGGNINFTDVQYAEIYVGIRGALYGPVILTSVFTNATTQNDLVFPITTTDLGIEQETFNDSLQDYYYGVSSNPTPPVIKNNIWPGESSYTLPYGSTENKIPFEVPGNAVRAYELNADIKLNADDQGVNPKITLSVNYEDGTNDKTEQNVPQDGTTNTYQLIINVDRTKVVSTVSGNLLDEDRSNISGRSGEITNISLNEDDLDLISTVKRGLVAEMSKQKVNQDLIALKDKILCGKKSFDENERAIIRSMTLKSATNGAKQGLTNNVDELINFLNDDC